MDQALAELIQAVKEIAPAVWSAAVRQVSVEIAQNIIWMLVILTIGIIGIVVGTKGYRHFTLCQKNYQEISGWRDSGESALYPMIFGYLFGIPCILFWLIPLADVIARIINPEWYAIQIIISLAK